MKYHHQNIESKWQRHWGEKKTFKAEVEAGKPKYYVLDMFPYPSGSGLHVGHVEGYTATDIMARYKRMKGYNVLHPMGWDSFGLPAEQYAVRTGTHPAETTKKNIDNFRRQLQALGFSYDWDREVMTSSPDYYKWTQWIFTKLYEKGLAYEAEMQVNYCPALGTVLANEEVENGKSIEGGHPVERRPLKQWMLKITAYAERLMEDLDLVDWPDSLKRLQRNWIGRSEGATVEFVEVRTKSTITVFTTRPDTLFGATYMVLSPEHPLVDAITTEEHRGEVKEYRAIAMAKSDMERTELAKVKTGVFTGAYAVNPVNGRQIPIWIADYVLISYGTGAIMAVPAHDERDFEFAKTYSLEIIPVFDPNVEAHPDYIPEHMSPEEAREKVLHAELCWPGEGKCINSSNAEISLNGLDVSSAKKQITDYLEGLGKGKAAVTYKLRDWLFSRQRYWGEPFPILHFPDGTKRVLGLDELPLLPPEIRDFKPTGDGRSPLARVKEWVEITDAKTGKKALRETNTMPQWAGSCWYYLRFCDPHNAEAAWSKEIEKYWMPVDMYIGGVEHAVLHLLYARFWHKVLYDCGLVSHKEPFKTLRNQGLITAWAYQRGNGAYVAPEDTYQKEGRVYLKETDEELKAQVEKMSKSKLNGVTPDEIIAEYGADTLRLYEMFMGPLEKEKIWNTDALSGCYRFLCRFYDMATSEKLSDEVSEEALKLGHRLVDGVSRDFEGLYFNVAIAKLMEFINDFTKLPQYPKEVVKMATLCLAPMAPHIAEEIWSSLGGKESIAYVAFPVADPKFVHEEMTTYVVQINGKVRGRLDLKKGKGQEEILSMATQDANVKRYVDGKEIKKVVFVPDKLINIVIAGF